MHFSKAVAAFSFAVSASLALAQYFVIPNGPGAGVTRTPLPAPNIRMSTYPLPGTDLVLIAPADFHVEDAKSYPQHDYRAIFGDPAGDTSCYPVLLALGGGDPLIHVQDSGAAHATPDPPTGNLAVQELQLKCIEPTPKNKNQFEDMAMSFISKSAGIPGYHPVSSRFRYQFDKSSVVLAATAHAWSKDFDGIRRKSAGQVFLVTLALIRDKRVFLWTFLANDPGVLNQLLSVEIRIDGRASMPLVPFTIQPDDGAGNAKAMPCDPHEVCTAPPS